MESSEEPKLPAGVRFDGMSLRPGFNKNLAAPIESLVSLPVTTISSPTVGIIDQLLKRGQRHACGGR